MFGSFSKGALIVVSVINIIACKNNGSEKPSIENYNVDTQNIHKDTLKIYIKPDFDTTGRISNDNMKLQNTKSDSLRKTKLLKKNKMTTTEKVNEEFLNEIDFAPIYKKKCMKCHGSNGKGKIEGVPNFTSQKFKQKDDSELFQSITDGIPGENEEDEDMPSFKKKLTEEEIKAAIKYIKSF